jgi:ubiquinone/menaquinone biosynthesis C-methylase UbiE
MNSQLHPKDILTPERFLEYEKQFIGSDRMDYILKCIDKENMKIIDIGGASGYFLNEIIKKTSKNIYAVNLDVDDYYSDKQVNENIRYINKSILESGIGNESYDIVTFRHVLHHLVSNNIKNTLDNQRKALDEMIRIVKKGGYLIFEEEINNVKLFSRSIFQLSKFANKIKFNFKFYETGKVVVSFLTGEEIKKILSDIKYKYNYSLNVFKYIKWNMPLRWKITILMASVGAVIVVLKKE